MKSRPIGFRACNDDYKQEQDLQEKLEKEKAEKQRAIADFLGQNYMPIGATSALCYKTTAELVYDLSNIIEVAPVELARQLSAAGYHVEYLAGQPYWVMYEKY